MHYLSHYTNNEQTKLFESTGAFFAFSNKQLDEAKTEGVTYVSLGAGLICPKDNAQSLVDGLEKVQIQGIALDIAENGKAGIIRRELGNHEAQITEDIDDTVDSLDGYGITRDEVLAGYKTFYQECIENDWF